MSQSQSQQNVLKRSHKADFSGINRERSFLKNNNSAKDKRRSQAFVKPAIELYRPPNVRSDLSPSIGTLNVHAKEFTMTQDQKEDQLMLQPFKSSGHLNQIMQQHYQQQMQQQHYQHQQNSLQHSKSSGSILKSPPAAWQFIPVPTGIHMPAAHSGLLHSSSTSTLFQHLHNQQQQQQMAAAAAVVAQQHRVSFHHHPTATPTLYGQQPFSAIYQPAVGALIGSEQTVTPVMGFRPQHGGGAGAALVYNGGMHVNGTSPSSMLLKRSKSFTTGGIEHQPSTFPSLSTRQHLKNLSNISEHFTHIHTPTSTITKHQSPNLNQSTANNISQQYADLIASFPTAEQRASLQLATVDPQQLSARTLIDLVRVIMERLIREGMTYAENAARLCVAVVDREREVCGGGMGTFGESMMNTCQQWYQERDKILRSIKPSPTIDGTRFTAFMWFLTELFIRLKRHQHSTHSPSTTDPPTDVTLLSILAMCCQACVTPPIRCLAETECLFFVLTSIGRELEQELPQQLDQLMACVRDGFLMEGGGGNANVRKTLLQLIELHASNWQLAGSCVLYYYPRSK